MSVTVRTNEAGNFTIPYLIAGDYTVESELTGFKKTVRDNIQVRVNDTVEVNLELQVGSTSESVEVSAETPLLTRFSTVVASNEPNRWLHGFYLDEPEEWDDPYRFFRW